MHNYISTRHIGLILLFPIVFVSKYFKPIQRSWCDFSYRPQYGQNRDTFIHFFVKTSYCDEYILEIDHRYGSIIGSWRGDME